MLENIALLIFFSHLLVIAFLLNVKKGNQLSNKLFAGYLICMALDLSNFLFGNFYSSHPNLEMLRANVALLTAPFVYGYINAVVYSDLKLKPKHLLHLLPFVLAVLVLIPNFYSADAEDKQAFYSNMQSMPEVRFILGMVYIQVALYVLAAYRTLLKQKKFLIETYSDEHHLVNRWLVQFLGLFSAFYLLALTRTLSLFSGFENLVLDITLIMLCVVFVNIYWILWQAMNHPQLFIGVRAEAIELANQPEVEQSSAAKPENDTLTTKLDSFMLEQKPFLEPSLNIDSLAQQVGVSSNELSVFINRQMGQHFFDFVNKHRIEFAANMLIDKHHSNKTVMEVLYASGFNSKSSFNTAFKKYKGVTPSQYRKNNL